MSRHQKSPSRQVFAAAALVPCLLGLGGPLEAQQVRQFATLAEFGDPRPGGGGVFDWFLRPQFSDDGPQIHFFGRGENTNEMGIYSWSRGSVTTLVDESTVLPGTSRGSSSIFSETSVPAGIVFAASNASTPNALYLARSGFFTRLLDHTTPRPQGGVGFDHFPRAIAGHDDRVAVVAGLTSEPTSMGIYLLEGASITRIVDGTTPVPGAAPGILWRTFTAVDMTSDTIAFHAIRTSGGDGIYRREADGSLHRVADFQTPVPGSGAQFVDIRNEVSLHDDGRIAFVARYVEGSVAREGVFVWENGTTRQVMDTSMTAPGTSDPFSGFGGLHLIGDSLVFVAGTLNSTGFAGSSGIYELRNGVVTTVLRTGDTLNGRLVTGFQGYDFDGSRVAVALTSRLRGASRDTVGVYLTSVPSAIPLGGYVLRLLLIGLLALVAVRHLRA